LIGFLIAVLVVSITQCASRPVYDLEILYFAYKPAVDAQTQAIGEYFENFAEDVNGDNEVNVQVINCSVTDNEKDSTRITVFSKIQAILAAEEKVLVYVVDDKAIEYFDNALDISIFTENPTPLNEEFYKQTTVGDYTLPDGLSAGLRVIEGTTFEKNKKSVEAYKTAEKLMKKIKKQGN
jgi:hypothetical protein